VQGEGVSVKKCSACHEIKPVGEFTRGVCKPCVSARIRKWYEEHPEALARNRQQSRQWQVDNAERCQELRRAHKLKNNFGITVAEYDEILDRQDGVCAICGKVCATGNRLAVDHNHETGKIRGLLCRSCNQALGAFLDDPDLLMAAVAYLLQDHQ